MAHHRHHRRHHHRRNPFGLNAGVLKDAAFNTGGALGASYLAGLLSLSGWMGVAGTGAAAVGLGMVGKFLGPGAGEEMLKGGLTATIIQALKQLGIAPAGLGLYAGSSFALPTVSDAYGRTLVSPYPLPALAAAPKKGLGAYRYRSRYAGIF